ncbi:MAG TPA: hypothetical protein VGP08_06070 [Pyrinomonadaceae bacterium]|nr:hypothetical protein [Pyrinomonadaceae bacterium]
MAVKKERRQRWKTGPLHWPGERHEDAEDVAGRLAPLEETDAFKDSQQKDASARTPDDTIRVDSASVQMPEGFVEDEREGASIFRLEPVALFILLAMLAFIVFVAWQISLMPTKQDPSAGPPAAATP